MSANFKLIAAAATASLFTTLVVTDWSAAAAPAPRHSTYCLSYSQGGRDCSFTSLAQCNATASGINAECSRDVLRTEAIPTREAM
jgi:Protein of unknown function (DUF3551)